MNLARSLALVTILVVLHQRGSVQAGTIVVSEDAVEIVAANQFTQVNTVVTFKFKSTLALAAGDTIKYTLPGFVMAAEAGTVTGTNCAGTIGVANSGEANAAITWTLTTAPTANQLCTIATAAAGTLNTGTLTTSAYTILITDADGTDTHATGPDTVDTVPTIVADHFSSMSLTFDAYKFDTNVALTLSFANSGVIAQGHTIDVVLPGWTVAHTTTTSTTSNCGSSVFTVSSDHTGQNDAKLTFTVSGADLAATTICTITTDSSNAKTPNLFVTGNIANAAQRTLANRAPAQAITTSSSVASPLYESELILAYPVVSYPGVVTFSFKSSLQFAINDKLKLTLPSWAVAAGTPAKVSGTCGTSTFAAIETGDATNSGDTNAAIVLKIATADLAKDTACSVTLPSGVATPPSTAQARDLSTRTVLSTIALKANIVAQPVEHSTATVTSASVSAALVVGTTTGSTPTTLALTFTSSVPLAVGDKLQLYLNSWTVAGTTAPTTTFCGSTTFTTATGGSGTANAHINFTVATLNAVEDTWGGTTNTARSSWNLGPGTNCTIHTATAAASTPATAQAANSNTRSLAVHLSGGPSIAPTTIATSTATTAAASSSNSTSTCTYGATSTCATRISQSIVISSLTVAAYTGNLKATYECSYARMVSPTWCTATTGAVSYLTGVQVTSTAAARRAATISFVMDVETSVMTAAAVQTAVASGVTAANLITQMTAINTATGWSVTVPTAADVTVNTAAFTGAATSSAAVVIPSAIMVLLGSLISLFWN